MGVWQVALVQQLRIMGPNPSQPHVLEEGRRKRRTGGRRRVEERVFRRHNYYNYWLHAPHLYLKPK